MHGKVTESWKVELKCVCSAYLLFYCEGLLDVQQKYNWQEENTCMQQLAVCAESNLPVTLKSAESDENT